MTPEARARLENPADVNVHYWGTCVIDIADRDALLASHDALGAERDHYKSACVNQNREIEQTLGRALGYPFYKDDPANFPDATEADGVFVGEHVAETLAMEAAKKLDSLGARVVELESLLKEERAVKAEETAKRVLAALEATDET